VPLQPVAPSPLNQKAIRQLDRVKVVLDWMLSSWTDHSHLDQGRAGSLGFPLVAERSGASRTPARQALYRLQREGFLDVNFRNGWEVRPLDFSQQDALYELRILLEQTSVMRRREAVVCETPLSSLDYLVSS
jgi:hypothetical protein